ncbi:MAG: hypothetical protein AAFO69_04360 [Bacteroidota bacterium]
MELVKTTEESLVLECLEKMLETAQSQIQNKDQKAANEIWQEHAEVISRAIHATKVQMIQTEFL